MRIPTAGFLLAASLTGSVFLSQSLAQETAVPSTNVERAGVGAADAVASGQRGAARRDRAARFVLREIPR